MECRLDVQLDMTHGGFDNHVAVKKDPALEVLNRGFTSSLGTVDAYLAQAGQPRTPSSTAT